MAKKLFISVPMKGRSEAEIRKTFTKLEKIAKSIWDEDLEVIDTFIKNDPPATNNIAIWMLGESIKKMAAADYFIGTNPCGDAFKGCRVEEDIARFYGIKSYIVPMEIACPDVVTAIERAMNGED